VEGTGIKPFAPGMRSPVVAPVTRFLLGVPLVFLTTQTADYFAWTIAVPFTAAFLGANYFASALLAILASRETVWAYGRLSISVALVFAPVLTAATFIHLDQFHMDSVFGWIWVIAYGVYCPMLAYFLLRQVRIPGGDPPPSAPLPGWMRVILVAHAALLIPLGIVLFIAPTTVADVWPWPLTPLTGRAISAWLLAFGVLAAHQLWENDIERIRVAPLGYIAVGLLQTMVIVRYPDDLEWGEAGVWVYLALVASTFVLGAFGYLALRRSRRERPEGATAAARPA
jgi:hypothetical protein